MTLDEARELLSLNYDVRQDGEDLIVSASGSWSWRMLQALSAALGTEAIDLAGRDEFTTVPGMTTIADRYKAIGGGCESCGHGDEVIVRGILR